MGGLVGFDGAVQIAVGFVQAFFEVGVGGFVKFIVKTLVFFVGLVQVFVGIFEAIAKLGGICMSVQAGVVVMLAGMVVMRGDGGVRVGFGMSFMVHGVVHWGRRMSPRTVATVGDAVRWMVIF